MSGGLALFNYGLDNVDWAENDLLPVRCSAGDFGGGKPHRPEHLNACTLKMLERPSCAASCLASMIRLKTIRAGLNTDSRNSDQA